MGFAEEWRECGRDDGEGVEGGEIAVGKSDDICSELGRVVKTMDRRTWTKRQLGGQGSQKETSGGSDSGAPD